MASLKGFVEDIHSFREITSHIHKWVSASVNRRLFVFFGVIVLLSGVPSVYMSLYLLPEVEKNIQNQTQKITDFGKAMSYKSASDIIVLCIDSTKEKPKLREWYCEQAVAGYERVSKDRLQGRVNEVVRRRAYGAMKADVSHYLRDLEFNRLIHASVPKREALNFILRWPVFVLWVVFFLVVAGLLEWWMHPKRKKAVLDDATKANPASD